MENSYVKVSVSCINQSIKKVNEQLYDHETNQLNFVLKRKFCQSVWWCDTFSKANFQQGDRFDFGAQHAVLIPR